MNFKTSIEVLLVDDSDLDYNLMRRYFTRTSLGVYHTTWAPSYERGFAGARTGDYDICLLDFRLGARTGLDFLRDMVKESIAMPVILLTGQGDTALAIEAMKLGALDYLDKNELNPDILERTIRYALENFRIRSALREANENLEHKVEERTAELRRSNTELERFAYIVSHELQLPLKTITSHIEQMAGQHTPPTSSDSQELDQYFVTRAYNGAKRMQSMISTVLEYSRVDKKAASVSTVDLSEVVETVLLDLESVISEKSAVVTRTELPPIRGNENLLAQLFKNLIGNALKFVNEQPPKIEVSCDISTQGHRIVVKDNGIGIPEDELADVFHMFHRTNTDTTVVGDGIGLALCKKIVETHGGRIWVESKSGEGAAFCMTFPTLSMQSEKNATQRANKDEDVERSAGVA